MYLTELLLLTSTNVLWRLVCWRFLQLNQCVKVKQPQHNSLKIGNVNVLITVNASVSDVPAAQLITEELC